MLLVSLELSLLVVFWLKFVVVVVVVEAVFEDAVGEVEIVVVI